MPIVVVAALQVNLNTLDLASNRVSRLSNISHLTKLEEFWVKLYNLSNLELLVIFFFLNLVQQ